MERQHEDDPALDADAEEWGDSLKIGTRVSAVFVAAEKAAQHMLTMAREQADDIRRGAEAEADALLQHKRLEADGLAERLLAEAKTEAESIRRAAEAEARETQAGAVDRTKRLREDARLLGEQLEWAREGLRDVLTRLDGLASAEAEQTDAEAPVGGEKPD